MDRQHFLHLADGRDRATAAKAFCKDRGLSDRQVRILCLFAEHGERECINGQAITRCPMSKSDAKKRLPFSPNTFLADVRALEAMGIVGVLEVTRPWTYVVNWSRVDKLEKPPDDPLAALAELPVCSEVWSVPVNVGQPVRDSVKEDSLESVYRGSVSSVLRDTDQLTELDRPWDRTEGVTDAELVACVANGHLKPLRRLYDVACTLGWIADCEDARLRFLTICHHAATCDGVGRRMGLVVSRTRRKLDVARIRQQSEDWAAAVLRRRRAAEYSHATEGER